jgi:hypothetical protein
MDNNNNREQRPATTSGWDGVPQRLAQLWVVGQFWFPASASPRKQPLFEVEKWAIGDSYYVRATLPDGTVERIEGFATEGEAGRWIRNESAAWLYSHSHRIEVS